jgi:hypothetical protein
MKSPPSCAAGHTLVELLTVLLVLGLVFSLLGIGLWRCVELTEARGAAQVWQTAGLWAQQTQMSAGGRVSLAVGPDGASLAGDAIGRDELSVSPSFRVVRANVSRWRQPPAIVVTFGGSYASPDSGGSLFLGAEPSLRVAVRPETGYTRREWHAP